MLNSDIFVEQIGERKPEELYFPEMTLAWRYYAVNEMGPIAVWQY